MTSKEQFAWQKAKHRLRILKHAQEITNNVAKTCRYYGIPRANYYFWKKRYDKYGIAGLKDRLRTPKSMPHATKQDVVDKIIYLRTNYHFGPLKIIMYLKRYHGIEISKMAAYRALKRHGLNRLPANQKYVKKDKRYKRYEKQMPGYSLQVDVKFLGRIKTKEDQREKKYYQYTAIDDCSRIRILKIYDRIDQRTSIQFTDYALSQMPFKINCVQTDNGSEFSNKYHWHLEDLGVRHIYIRPRTPRLNGKVERSHRIDEDEFYHMLKGKVINSLDDLNFKIKTWQDFYNFNRPHGGLDGKTPFEKFQSKLNTQCVER